LTPGIDTARRCREYGGVFFSTTHAMIKAHFDMLAGYNAWANTRLYDAAATLSDADYRADGGAFFGSVHRTLNHLLATDRIWYSRCAGEDDTVAPKRTIPDRLDAVLFEDFAELRRARELEDGYILGYVRGLPPGAFGGVIRYRRVSTPERHEQALNEALAHWFNHQTHHRGQAHALLTRFGAAGPELDLLFYQRLVRAGKAV
jgi:uncharacterized damage-inducible protein DinB